MTLPFNPLDAAIVAVIGVAIWSGYRAGFVATLYSLATWVLAATAAVVFQGPAAGIIGALLGAAPLISGALGFVAVVAAVEALATLAGHFAIGPVVTVIHRFGPLAFADRLLGVIPAVGRSLFIVGVALAALVALPVASELKAAVETSAFGRILIQQVAAAQPQLAALTGQLGGTPLLATKLAADQSGRLDFPDGLALEPDPVAERQMLDQVNQERTSRGLSPLAWDDRLLPVARQHSDEMFRLKYLADRSPVTGSLFDRLRSAGITSTRAAENVAYAPSVTGAMQRLMSSPEHRDNILGPQLTRIAVGVVSAGAYGRMFTQMFLAP